MHSIFGPASKLLSIAFLVSMNFWLGTEVTWRDIQVTLRDQHLLGRALAANLVLVPLLGLALDQIFRMAPDFATAFLLLACAPGAPMSLSYTRKKLTDAPFAAALAFVLGIGAICFTAPLAELVLPVTVKVNMPFGRVVAVGLLLMVLPGFAGTVVQRWSASHVIMMRKASSISATVFALSWMLLVAAEQSQAVRQIGIRTLVAMLALILGSMAIGWLMGGPTRDHRRILASGTSMRNIALCAVIAFDSFPGSKVELGIVAFSALMVTPNTILAIHENYRGRRKKALAASQ